MERDRDQFGGREMDMNAATTNAGPTMSSGQRRIKDYWKTATGRDATQQEYSQWGGDIDDNYFRKISGAIDGLDESKAYKAGQNLPPQGEPPPDSGPAPAQEPPRAFNSSGGGGGATLQHAPPQNTAALDAYIQQLIQQNQARDAETATQRANVLGQIQSITDTNSRAVTSDDPIISAQANAFRGEGERALRMAKKNSAERNYARTGGSGEGGGGLDAEIQQMYEGLGRNSGNYTAGLMGSENSRRSNNLMGAAQMGAGILSGEQSRNLQQQMGLLNTQAGLEKSRGDNALGWEELFQRPELARIGQSAGMASANNQNQQFYDRFAWDQSKYANDNDNLLMQYLLRG